MSAGTEVYTESRGRYVLAGLADFESGSSRSHGPARVRFFLRGRLVEQPNASPHHILSEPFIARRHSPIRCAILAQRHSGASCWIGARKGSTRNMIIGSIAFGKDWEAVVMDMQ